jgi:hypothetical protein
MERLYLCIELICEVKCFSCELLLLGMLVCDLFMPLFFVTIRVAHGLYRTCNGHYYSCNYFLNSIMYVSGMICEWSKKIQ